MSTQTEPAHIELSNAQKIALRRAARNGDYHLMLGAGSSLDSKDTSGRKLPNSGELISRLCSFFGVAAEENDLLWRVYDRAIETSGEENVYRWFRERFWNVEPPYWMSYYARSPWASVWTLNIDDTFEAAHREIATETSRSLNTLNWDDEFRVGRPLNIVHLHGVVDRDEPRKLVFSLSEYANSATQGAPWSVNFRDSYGNSPFVILGARLRDEPDIEAVMSRRNPMHPAPSFYVSRSISPATRSDLLRWGLIPVEMTAEDFVLQWSELTGLDLEHGWESDQELGMRVGQQFKELRLNTPGKTPSGHDFLGGNEPLWEDIQMGLAAELEWLTNAKMDCNQIGQSIPGSSVLVYAGRRLSGRSAGLLMIAKHLRSSSWRTFLFRESGRIDIDAVLGFAADGKPTALLFDGMSAVADDVDRLISEAKGAGLNIVCVGVDDKEREATILGRVHTANLAHGRVAKINGRLTGTDANRLVDTLSSIGRLGILESESDRKRTEHFKNRDLFDRMAQLENAPGFGLRVSELLGDVIDTQKRSLILLASYSSFIGGHLLVIDASRMVGLESDELVRRVISDPQLSALLSTDTNTIRTRHRWMALEPLVTALGEQAAADIVRDGVRRVSARLSQQSLRERNPTSVLVGRFMSYRKLHEIFPGADLDTWYASLIDVFGSWSARYWEQRAILARNSDVTQLAKAESFALRAAEIVPDAYSFTTLGTVLMEKAARAQVNVREYYDRANSAFDRASRLDSSGNSLVTWIAFLRSSLKVLERLDGDNGIKEPDKLASETTVLVDTIVSDWSFTYAQIGVLRTASEQVSTELDGLRRRFEGLTRKRGPEQTSM